jgi:hypothetical protein
MSLTWLVAAASVFWANGEIPAADPKPAIDSTLRSRLGEIPLNQVAQRYRTSIRKIVDHPTLACQGPLELFQGKVEMYQWLLDHPDQAVSAWRRLGANCMDINDLGGGRFGWSDGDGSSIHWETALRTESLRIWYAEGKLRPAPFLPAVPARAVVVLHYGEPLAGTGRFLIRHQADLYVQTDSKMAALAARLLGASVPKLGQQCVGQLELFFSALAWYLDRHPEKIDQLLPACRTSAKTACLETSKNS